LFAKKQKQGKVYNYKDAPLPEEVIDTATPAIIYEVEERVLPEEDDI
jgi:hypothetical protein